MKVSREGIVLIKSFEGFRPRAIRREDGGWVIGYGHTLSAREGASVSEADAELLLRYDLLPVEKTVNQAGSAVLNQHQFDALASFAFSVGIDRFQTSDVLVHLTQGALGQAANALMGWPEPVLPQAGLRRRAAERALFVADPATPMAVSDLLVAPVGEAEVPSAVVPSTPPPPAATLDRISEGPPPSPPVPEPHIAPPLHPRDAAVSALLGELELPPSPEALTAIAVPPPANDPPPAANDREAETVPSVNPSARVDQAEPEPRPEPGAEAQSEPQPEAPAASREDAPEPASDTPDQPQPVEATSDVAALPPRPTIDASALTVQRYSPYSAPMFGPLPFLPPASAPGVDLAPAPAPSAPPEAHRPEPAVEIPAAEPERSEETPVIQPFAPPAEVEPLVLSPPDDAPLLMASAPAWAVDERQDAVESADGGLFGEDLSLTQGGAPILRHGDIEVASPASFDWSETGAFVTMGAVGLIAFGAAMAAFRLASEQTGGDETTIIAWVLAVIGAGCVGVSSFNLYRRWGLPGGDN